MEAFEVPAHVDLEDLRSRLLRTRFAVQIANEAWAGGMPPAFLRDLVSYWLKNFRWSEIASHLNRYPHRTVSIEGTRVHFVHAARPGAPAILLLHGWPYSFAEMLPLVDHLAADFDVVVPSIPGFVYSEALKEPFGDVAVARMMKTLMTDVLGRNRFLTYGEDVGTWISDRIAGTYPESVHGIVVSHPAYPPPEVRESLDPESRTFFLELSAARQGEKGYAEIQSTKPDTLAASLADSPAGLAAWIAEKLLGWSNSGDRLDAVFSFDELLTTVMLYWSTGCISTSFHPYYDSPLQAPQPSILVPAAIALAKADHGYPRSLAEHTYKDIRSFETLPHSGHFVAREAPEDIARLARSLL